MRLGRTALFHFGTQIIISLSGFAATFFIGVVGGSSELGLYANIVALGFFWLAIPTSGISQAIKKRISEGEEQSAFYTAGVVFNAAVSVCLGSLVLITGLILRSIGAPDQVLILVLVEHDVEIATLVVGAAMMQTTMAGLEGQKLVAQSGGIQAAERILRSTFQIIVVVLGFGVAAISFGHVASLLLISLIGLWLTSLNLSRPKFDHFRSLAEYAKYAWVGALQGQVYTWMDTLMLGIFLSGAAGASLIGVYEVAWGIGSILATMSVSISNTLFPEMSDLSVKGDLDKVAHLLEEGLAFSGIIVLPGLVGAAVIGERVLLFYRPEYVQGMTVLVILVAAYAADVYATQLINAVNAIDRPEIGMRVNAVFIVVNILLNAILIWELGWVGAAIATAISAGVRFCYSYYVVRRIIQNMSFPFYEVTAQATAAVVMGGIITMIAQEIPQGRAWTLALVGVGAVVYFTTLSAISGRVRNKLGTLVQSG